MGQPGNSHSTVADNLGAGFGQLILGAVFPVGLIITVLTGAELFTGDAMLAPLAAFHNKVTWAKVLNLWVWVYIGNLIGSIFFAYIMANGPFVSFNAAGLATVNAFGLRAVTIGLAKTSYVGGMGFYSALLKGLGCNWLVNLAILLGICADDAIGKFFGIWFPIMAFVSIGFEHSVANMYFIPAGILTSGYLNAEQVATFTAEKLASLNWVSMWTSNIIPVTIGNIIGGMIFVGVIYCSFSRKKSKQSNLTPIFYAEFTKADTTIDSSSLVFAFFLVLSPYTSLPPAIITCSSGVFRLFYACWHSRCLAYCLKTSMPALSPEYEADAKSVNIRRLTGLCSQSGSGSKGLLKSQVQILKPPSFYHRRSNRGYHCQDVYKSGLM